MEETKMGMFKVKARVANAADPKRFFEEEFSVDIGSTYTFIPEDRLKEIGIEPLQTSEIVLADGPHERRLLGPALLTLPELKETLPSLVMFGPNDSLYLLGAMALEAFSVEPDPIAKKLRPIAAIIGAHWDTR